eukprot:6849279-Ditylum_brightwellii.AAC.1
MADAIDFTHAVFPSIQLQNKWYLTPICLEQGVILGMGEFAKINAPSLSSQTVEIVDKESLFF